MSKKQRQRQRTRDEGEISDKTFKKHLIIQSICAGKKIRSNLVAFGITLDMIPCDQSIIHPDVLEQLQISTEIIKQQLNKDQSQIDKPKIKVRIKSTISPQDILSFTQAIHSFDQAELNGDISYTASNTYKRDLTTIIKLISCLIDDIIPCFINHIAVLDTIRQKYPNIRTYKK